MIRVTSKKVFQVNKRNRGSVLIEAVVCFIVFIPIAFLAADLAMLIATAHQNEEFAEQLARLCSTLTNKPNAIKACEDVIKQYQVSSAITDIELENVIFDLGIERVTIVTSMTVKMPVPFPGFERKKLTASVTQPIVGIPTPY